LGKIYVTGVHLSIARRSKVTCWIRQFITEVKTLLLSHFFPSPLPQASDCQSVSISSITSPVHLISKVHPPNLTHVAYSFQNQQLKAHPRPTQSGTPEVWPREMFLRRSQVIFIHPEVENHMTVL
jgi:hypothetical protein